MDTDQMPDARHADTGEAPKYTTPVISDYGDLVELTSAAGNAGGSDGTFMHSRFVSGGG